MTPEEWAKQALFADGRFLANDEMGKTIERVIRLALTERTEQCAKIAGKYMGAAAQQIAEEIRALNQPERP